jgi:hypothetical protein
MTIDILNIKPWVIFLAFLLIFGPMVVLIDYIKFLLDDPVVTILGTVFLLTIYLLYPMLVGLNLRSLLSSQTRYVKRTDISLMLDWCMVLIPYSITSLVNFRESMPNITVLAIGVVGLIGIARIGSFSAYQIRSIELRRNAGTWEYISETLQMIYWPLGVLWMQPRINRIATRTTKISE